MKNDTKIGRQCLRLTLGLLVIWTTSAQAAEVFGLKFGQPVPFPECERDKLKGFGTITDKTCFNTDTGTVNDFYIMFPSEQRPQIVRDNLYCIVVDGKLERIMFETYGSRDIERVLAALTTKYGTPSSIERPVVQNAMGAQYDNLIAKWTLPNLSVQFRGLNGSTDYGVVVIFTPKGKAEYNRRNTPRDDPRPL